MNSRVSALCTGISMVLYLTFGQAAHAVTCDPGAEPGNPDVIYEDRDDGTVTDTRTGLMWKKCAEGSSGVGCNGDASRYRWDEALAHARSHEFAEYNDWRVPSVKELFSLIEDCSPAGPSININVFPNDPGDYFWSNSNVAMHSDWISDYVFWVVDTELGATSWSSGPDQYPLRLVRDVEPQPALPRVRLSVWMDPEWSELQELQCRDEPRSYRYTLFVKEELGVRVTLDGLDWQIFDKDVDGFYYLRGAIIDSATLEQWFGSLDLEAYETIRVNLCQVRGSADVVGAAIHRVYGTDVNGYFVEGSATNFYASDPDYYEDFDHYGVEGLFFRDARSNPVVDVVR